MRTRVRWTLTDENGGVIPYASVRVYNADGKTLYRDPLYRQLADDQTFPNPFNAAPVRLEFFLDRPVRVILGFLLESGAKEVFTPAIEALPNAEEIAYAVDDLTIEESDGPGILRALSSREGYWYRPGLGSHDHSGPAENSLALGSLSPAFSQLSGYPGATVLGGHDEQIDPDVLSAYTWGLIEQEYPTWGHLDAVTWGTLDQTETSVLAAPAPFDNTTTVGRSSTAAGPGSVSAGARADSRATVAAATALGTDAAADGQALVIGENSGAIGDGATTLGPDALGMSGAVAAGQFSSAPADGIVLGRLANSEDAAADGSIILGPHARLLARQDSTVLLGAASPDTAMADAGGVEGPALLIQQLAQLLAPGDLQVDGDVALGGAEGKIGFFGHAPTGAAFVGGDEVASGIEALDSLIYALRDLGLIRTRRDAVARYSPDSLAQAHQLGDEIRNWPEAIGTGRRLVSAFGAEPHYTGVAKFDQNRTPWEFALTEYAVEHAFLHVVVVASHDKAPMRPDEGLAGVYAHVTGTIATSYPIQPLARTWTGWTTTTGGLAKFAVDGRVQSRSLAIDTQTHVYQVTSTQEWPEGVWFALGRSGYPGTPGWPGAISEAALLDSSWTERDVASYAIGLSFQYNVAGSAEWLRVNALKFLRSQQGDLATFILFNQDYPSTNTVRMVSGKVLNYAGISTKNVPLLRVGNYSAVVAYSYDGAVAGYWSYLANPQNYYLEFYSFPNGFAGTWSADALVGRFSLNASGTWSTGTKRVRRGVKRWRLVLRSTLAPVVTDEWVPGAYYDTAVRIYTETGGVRTLEATVPLQGDGSWFGTTRNEGRVIAELVRRSTSGLLATTDRHLPVDVLARSGDADYATASARGTIRTAALTAIAYLGAGQQYEALAGDILRALRALQQADGSLYAAYDVLADPVAAVTTDIFARDLAWVGIAAALFAETTGDFGRFEPLVSGIAEYLIYQQSVDTGSIADIPGGDYSTETSAVCWLLFHTLHRTTGVDSWGDVAASISTALQTTHWDATRRRFVLKAGSTARDTRADIWGGLYQIASGQRGEARLSLRSLAYAKRTDVDLDDSHFTGPTDLAGYLPTNTGGTITLDHEATWAALLFRAAYGEPVGEDLTLMRRWTAATPNPWAQFLNYSTDAGALIVRPAVSVAAQALMMAQGTTLFRSGPAVPPSVVATRLAVTKLANGGYQFAYEWVPEDERQPTAFEVVPERSFDNGATWVAMPSRSRKGQISQIRQQTSPTTSSWPYGASWTESGPLTNSTVTRVNIRMRAKEFGSWATTEARYPDGRILPFVSPPLLEAEPDGEIPA